MDEYKTFLTTQLVIRHLLTGKEGWKKEFHRRLKRCGIPKNVREKVYEDAKAIFLREGSRGVEAASYYRTPAFDGKEGGLQDHLQEMVHENRLTFSEVAKIVDEAEYLFATKGVAFNVWVKLGGIVLGHRFVPDVIREETGYLAPKRSRP